MNYATSYGLAFSSGVNAYLPLLSFAIAVKWFHLYKVNPAFSYITQDWFIIALVILALADIFADKIPGVDHVWDAIHTVLRPIAGAVVVAASSNPLAGTALIAPTIAGASLAGMVHTTKAVTRVASTTMTAGCLNIGLSTLEDLGMVAAVLLSLLAPAVMAVIIVIFVIMFLVSLRYMIRILRRNKQKTKKSAVGSQAPIRVHRP